LTVDEIVYARNVGLSGATMVDYTIGGNVHAVVQFANNTQFCEWESVPPKEWNLTDVRLDLWMGIDSTSQDKNFDVSACAYKDGDGLDNTFGATQNFYFSLYPTDLLRFYGDIDLACPGNRSINGLVRFRIKRTDGYAGNLFFLAARVRFVVVS
jgi:hypothetical protein